MNNNSGSLDQRSTLISRALSSPLLASRSTSGLDVAMMQDQMMCCEMVCHQNATNYTDLSADTRLLQNELDGSAGGDSTTVMIIDNIDDPRTLEKTSQTKSSPNKQHFSIVENSSHSLDLTTSSSRSVSLSSGAGGGGGGTEGGGSGSGSCATNNKSESAGLNFNYTPKDPARVSCNFIYNPVFNKSSSTGLIYELGMCNHKCICGDENNHPENSHRILAVWRRLYEMGLMAKCARIEGRRATIEELQLCHR